MDYKALQICIFLVVAVAFRIQARGPLSVLGQQKGFFQGDIVLNQKNRNGILAAQRWPNGVIPYEYGAPWTQKHIDLIQEAMRAIQASTCIRFVKRSNEQNYITIKNTTGGCYTYAGMQGGSQIVSLNDQPGGSSCFSHAIIVHELLHAIGLWHEQSRYDRDQYITINWQNMDDIAKSQFRMVLQNQSSTYGIPYNYYSVMHYDAWSMTSNDEVTIMPRDLKYVDIIGTVAYGHELDWEKVRRIYECKGTFTPAYTTTQPTKAPEYCSDKYADCGKMLHTCRTEASMQTWCRKSCGFCRAGQLACEDKTPQCRVYKNQCTKQAWMKDQCEKTCGTC